MRFLNLEYFWVVILSLAVIYFCWRFGFVRQKQLLRFLGGTWQRHFGKAQSQPFTLPKLFFLSFAVVFLFLAWLRPQVPEGEREVKSQGIELLVLADVSWSMLAEDVGPSRLERMKLDLMRLSEKLTGHQVGLAAFAGSAHLMSPFTRDQSAIRLYVDSLAPTTVSHQGTNFMEALTLAKEMFAESRKKRGPEAHVTQAILFLSDGEDHEPGLEKAVEGLLEQKIRVFAFGYGTEAGAKIPDRDSLGFLKGYRKDQSGQEILSKFTGVTLEKIANAGEGQIYYPAFDTQAIDNFIKYIERLNQMEFESQSLIDYAERFQVFLLIGILLLVFLLGWETLRPLRALIVKASLVCLLALAASDSAWAFTDLKDWLQLQEVHQLIEAGKVSEARVRLTQDQPKLHGSLKDIYLGYLFILDKDVPNAIKAFATADRAALSNEEQFLSRFNQGYIFQVTKQNEKALEAYQRALEVRPESIETKINIELLIQQMQSGGGGGQSDQQQNEGDQDEKEKEEPKEFKENPKQQFESEQLTPQDVQRIMQELQQQERKIRSEFGRDKGRQKSNEKDW